MSALLVLKAWPTNIKTLLRLWSRGSKLLRENLAPCQVDAEEEVFHRREGEKKKHA